MTHLMPEFPDLIDAFWQNVMARLRTQLPEGQIKTWVEPLDVAQIHEQKIVVYAPNRFKLDYARKQLIACFEDVAQELWGKPMSFHFLIANKEQQAEVSKKLMHQQLNLNIFDDAPQTANNKTIKKHDPIASQSQTKQQLNTLLDNIQKSVEKHQQEQSLFGANVASSFTEAADTRPKQVRKNANLVEHSAHDAYDAQASALASMAPKADASRLNQSLSFDTFILGQANSLARSAAVQLAMDDKRLYNPCYFYGQVGLGKTHLIHAIGNHARQKNPRVRVRYIHAEQFVSDVVKSYQKKAYDDLKKNYHHLDILLIDDIQFLAGKNRTQEEFFHMFEHLLNERSQIILTADCYPKDLKDIDPRLISRFTSGLMVSIQPPELDMRIAILKSKAARESFDLHDDVAFFIANHLSSNVRELEGALRKYMAFHLFHPEQTPSMHTAREALKDIIPTLESLQNTQAQMQMQMKSLHTTTKTSKKNIATVAMPTSTECEPNKKTSGKENILPLSDQGIDAQLVEHLNDALAPGEWQAQSSQANVGGNTAASNHAMIAIQKMVAQFYGVALEDIASRKRSKPFIKPRQVAIFLVKQLTHLSFADIGRAFDGRDHSTIMHAVKKIQTERELCAELNAEVENIWQSFLAQQKNK